MSKVYKVLVEFPTKADSEKHAEVKVKSYLEGKGIRNDGLVPVEHYIFVRPNDWK